jgi:MerR family transcriptional regulator, heat shock protein HspR
MEINKDKPVYVISVVSEMLDIPPQTLRIYEKANLVMPQRTKQNTRLYSQTDIEKLQRIVRLHQDLGINLAGIEVILHMRQRMEFFQSEFQKMIELIRDRFGADLDVELDENSTGLVPLSEQGAQIMRLIDILKSDKSSE